MFQLISRLRAIIVADNLAKNQSYDKLFVMFL